MSPAQYQSFDSVFLFTSICILKRRNYIFHTSKIYTMFCVTTKLHRIGSCFNLKISIFHEDNTLSFKFNTEL